MTMVGVVLAAGGGTRFAGSGATGPKQRALVQGEPLLSHALRAALDAGLDEVAVVQGAEPLDDLVPPGIDVLPNPRWAEGMATSLQVAVAHARRGRHDAVVVGLADQPGVLASAWRAVAAAPEQPPIAVATYAGRRGNPVRISESAWPLLPTEGDEGARSLMRRRPSLVREVPCDGEPGDVDTMEDLDRWS